LTSLEQNISTYFGQVSREELGIISSHFKATQIKRGEYYLHTGDPCLKMSFIQEGLMRIYVQSPDKEVTQWISTPGYFITDLSSFMFDTPARWNIQALTDCELYTITQADYRNLGKELPQWHALEKLFLGKCFTIMEDRIFSHLSMTAEERYAYFFEHNKELFNQVPLQYIASLLGMTSETFSRVRKKQLG
jgi:CRP-like cAMP-binding protein